MKNTFFSTKTATVALLLISTLFFACKKDTLTEKLHKYSTTESLYEIELYTPAKETAGEKLVAFANYVNHPADYHMPNMELKEAVWFMETFFNIGICDKQIRIADQYEYKTQHRITVAFTTNDDGEILLNGEMLQTRYNQLLATIVRGVNEAKALNLGDVYVSSINESARTVVLELDVLWGEPTPPETAGDDIWNPRRIFLAKNQNASLYFNYHPIDPSNPDVVRPYAVSSFAAAGTGADGLWLPQVLVNTPLSYRRDMYMQDMLNSRAYSGPIYNVTNQHRKLIDQPIYQSGLYMITSCSGTAGACLQSNHAHGSNDGSAPQITWTPAITNAEFVNFGNMYKDEIYANMPWMPLGYFPLYGTCFYLFYNNNKTSFGKTQLVFQMYGIEYTASSIDVGISAAVTNGTTYGPGGNTPPILIP